MEGILVTNLKITENLISSNLISGSKEYPKLYIQYTEASTVKLDSIGLETQNTTS